MPSVVNEFGAMAAAPDAFDLRLVDLGGGEAMVEVHTSGGTQRSGVDIEIVLDVSGSMATESEVQDAAGNVQRHGFYADAADDGPVGDLALGRGGVAAHGGGPDDAADADDTTAWNSGAWAVETDASPSLH